MRIFFLNTLLVIGIITLLSCEKTAVNFSQDEDKEELQLLFSEIETLANQFNCENNVDWKFVEIGAKPCGGPNGYIAYSNKIDENIFLNKVKIFTEKQKRYNENWKIFSDCKMIRTPVSVACVNGKPNFVY